MATNYPGEYERVPGLDEVDPKDFLALRRARDQWTRDRFEQAIKHIYFSLFYF